MKKTSGLEKTRGLEDESVVAQVRRWKEENAAKHGYAISAILASAREAERAHPDRMVTRIRSAEERAAGLPVRSRPASEKS